MFRHSHAAIGMSIALMLFFLPDVVAQPSLQGQWAPLTPLEINDPDILPGPPNEPVVPDHSRMQAIHAVLLRDGRILIADLMNDRDPRNPAMPAVGDPNDDRPDVVLFNPLDGKVKNVGWPVYGTQPPFVQHRVFCSGTTVLSDGKVAVFGGGAMDFPDTPGDCPGTFLTSIFDPAGSGPSTWWIRGPDEKWPMQPGNTNPASSIETRRWYPTPVHLGGTVGTIIDRVLVVDGACECAGCGTADPNHCDPGMAG